MLPIVDQPLIQYAVEEAIAAGITDMIFITGRTKRSIEDHFDKAYELETELEARGKKELLEIVRQTVPKGVNCIYIRQSEALGLGHAVRCASHVVSDEAFVARSWPTTCWTTGTASRCQSRWWMCTTIRAARGAGHHERAARGNPQLRYLRVTETDIGQVQRMTGIVEKPKPERRRPPRPWSARYILTPRIFDHIRALKPGAGGRTSSPTRSPRC